MFQITVATVLLLAFGATYAEPIRIVALGGSNTFGKNLNRSEAYPAQLEALLKSRGIDAVVSNEGVNGQTTEEELHRLSSTVPEGTRIVIFQPGGNDKRSSKKHGQVKDTEENIRAIVKTLLDRQVKVLFSGGKGKQRYIEDLDVRAVDEISSLAPNDLQPDGEHLTANGYKIVAMMMLPILEELLETKPLVK